MGRGWGYIYLNKHARAQITNDPRSLFDVPPPVVSEVCVVAVCVAAAAATAAVIVIVIDTVIVIAVLISRPVGCRSSALAYVN